MFGKKFRAARKEAKLSLNDLQKIYLLNKGQLSRIENAKERPSDFLIDKLAEIKEMGVSHETLVAWRTIDDTKKPEVIIKAFKELYPDKAEMLNEKVKFFAEAVNLKEEIIHQFLDDLMTEVKKLK